MLLLVKQIQLLKLQYFRFKRARLKAGAIEHNNCIRLFTFPDTTSTELVDLKLTLFCHGNLLQQSSTCHNLQSTIVCY